jgi:predicted DNA-binding transcriptional regulator YafY
MLLLVRRSVTLQESAIIFDVVPTTIQRDVLELIKAGFPIQIEPGGKYGGISIPREFREIKNITRSSDIVSLMIDLLDEYPQLLDNQEYILARYRRGQRQTKCRVENKPAAVKVTVRFEEKYISEIERKYDLDIISLEDGWYKAYIYIGASDGDHDALFLIGDKCKCIEPRYLRDYIKNKAESVLKDL